MLSNTIVFRLYEAGCNACKPAEKTKSIQTRYLITQIIPSKEGNGKFNRAQLFNRSIEVSPSEFDEGTRPLLRSINKLEK